MKLRTEIDTNRSLQGLVSHSTRVVTIGSCFSDSIGGRLRQSMIPVTVNPLGTLYNPASILGAVERLADRRPFAAADLFEHGGMWHTLQLHGSFSRPTAEGLLAAANGAVAAGADTLRRADVAFVTLGSDIVYTDRQSGSVAANCHKLPAARFTRSHLGADGTADALLATVDALRRVSPRVAVIFTVSPVRHVGEGLHDNQLSKAALLVAADRAASARSRVGYFPAYEIMMDDLRDYRFYAADMKHPSDVAVEYIYERFADCYCTPATRRLMAECESFSRMLAHRPLHAANAAAHREALEQRAAALETKLPYFSKDELFD